MEKFYLVSYLLSLSFHRFYLCGEVLCNGLCHLSWEESVCGKVLSFIFIFYHFSSSFLSCHLLSFYLLSVWRSFMQWVVSLELPGECVWKGFIFPRDISVCTRHTQTIYSFSSSNSFYLISF